jgi:hypothetical protein
MLVMKKASDFGIDLHFLFIGFKQLYGLVKVTFTRLELHG